MIRLIELFSGIGAQAMALKQLGIEFEHYRAVDFDKYAIASYNAIHGTDFQPVDICAIRGADLGIVDTYIHTYIMTYSFPCFTKDTLILTDKGFNHINHINEGDMVMTHNGEYRKVLSQRCTGTKEIYEIHGMGIDNIRCTENHKFYVREMYRRYPSENGRRKSIRLFREPQWVECKDLTKKHYMGVPVNRKSVMPKWDGIDFEWSDGRSTRHKNQISSMIGNTDFWYVVGRWLGDGWERSQGGIIICSRRSKLRSLTERLSALGINYSIARERTVDKVHIPSMEFSKFMLAFGHGAINKYIPGFVFDMPVNLIDGLLNGYKDSDGYVTKSGLIKISSVSRPLVYGIGQLVAKAYHRPYSVYKTVRPETCIIEARTVNQHNSYTVTWKMDKGKQDKAFYEDGCVWFPITEVKNTHTTEEVYDLEVEEDHSFTANGVIAHNCQDLSVAGLGRGMEEGSGTRSSLLWEVKRLLNECKELPQILLMENVPQVHSKKNIDFFQKWLDFLTSKGYTNYWKDLNAKDYGVAQSRNRCFVISFLGPHEPYKFEEPIPLSRCMKDYLEEGVEEKFYVKSDRAKQLIDKLIINGTIPEINQGWKPVDMSYNNPTCL